MALSRHANIVGNLKSAVETVLKEVEEFDATDEQASLVVDAVRVVLENGLEGNRSVRPFVWSVVRRIGMAYPVTFHPSIDKVRALARQDALDRKQVERAWIKQALHEGVMSTFIRNVIRQFQIRSAYLSEAVICDRNWRTEITQLVDQMKDRIQPVPEAPSVSSWSSDDSFVYTPRSSIAEDVHPSSIHHALLEKSHDEVAINEETVSGCASEDDAEFDSRSATATTSEGSRQRGKPPRKTHRTGAHHVPGVVKQTASIIGRKAITQESNSEHSTSSESRKQDRPSLFGRITRTISGSLYHSIVSSASQNDGSMPDLSLEERTSRFWSRRKSGSSVSLLRDIEKDIAMESSTPVSPEERLRAGRMLVKELTRTTRAILQQYCSNGVALKVDIYPLSAVLPLYADAFAVGLRPSPLFQPSVPNMYLSDFEKILPEGETTPFSVVKGIQKIYPEKDIGVKEFVKNAEMDDALRFQEWLKESLLDRCLAQRIETVLEHQRFLEGWYYSQAIITDEDLLQEIIASCRGLNTIAIEGAQQVDSALSDPLRHSQPSTSMADVEEKGWLQSSAVTDMSCDCEKSGDTYKVNTQTVDHEWIEELRHSSPVHHAGSPSLESDNATSTEAIVGAADMQRYHSTPAPPTSNPNAQRKQASRGLTRRSHGDETGDEHQLPTYQQITLATEKMGRLRLGEPTRTSAGGHSRSLSVMSSCVSGEDEIDWQGVWKDVDVVRHERRISLNGELYVAYIIELVASDGTHWQTARRFSDLVTLNKNLLKQGVELPHSWTNLHKARIVAGKKKYSMEIVEARQALIRQCLWDLMTAFPESLIWTVVAEYLDAPLSLLRGTKSRHRGGICADEKIRNMIYDRINNHLGRMALIVELPVQISDEVIFEIQKGLCAGCQTYLPCISNQKFIFGKSTSPRKCQYTELLYCHKCHRMDTAYLPARVLHCWDFEKYTVSVGAKSYLLSMFPTPVLCINAVNPGLLASVPTLAHLEHLRKNIVRRMDKLKAQGVEGKRIVLAVEENAGENKHLLQNADYWSMKDLGDISRGVFARLPRWLEAVNKQIERLAQLHSN